ncbi:MAG: branched-chain amino acid ABC transporter permease [Streptosporangiales bacterium]|nr:branched-chain amino acid ABC transporter permease [Streptosporangiales bacterium]
MTAAGTGTHTGTRTGRQLLVLVIGAAAVATLPFILPPAQEAVAVRILIFALMGVAWNVMSGYGGMFSFGHAAYFGLGAYAGGYLIVRHGVSPWIGMAVGAALAAAFGVTTGFLAFRYRLKGAYFALATFAFAEMLHLLALSFEPIEAAAGLNVPLLQGSSWWMLQFPPGSPNYFWAILALTVLAVAATIALLRSKSGGYVIAIREDEQAASSLGIPVMRYKLLTVGVSAAMTAVAGAFYVQYYLYINPDLAFGSAVSIQAILPSVIGGIGTIWGPLIGAAVLGPLSDVTATLLRDPPAALAFLEGRSGLDVILYAALLIVIVLALPKGVYGALRSYFARGST